MAVLDIEALLDSTASGSNDPPRSTNRDDRDEERRRHDRSRELNKRSKADDDEENAVSPKSEREQTYGSRRNRRRSRSSDRRSRRGHRTDNRDEDRTTSGDFYRGGGRQRTRSRSPDPERRSRNQGILGVPPGEEAETERYRDRDSHRERGGRNGDSTRRRSRSPRKAKAHEPRLTEDERDRRTVFVQQLAARLRTKELVGFFEKVGPVNEAQIVKDRVSGRSKGVGYVEFMNEESVQAAIQLTGQKLLGIPIIAQLTEAEKNRQSRNPEASGSVGSGVPFHRLYVGNIHFSITEQDLQNVFEPFGELEFVQLQKEEGGRSRGYGFVQFLDPGQAKEALEKMNGFELAGRPIRVGLGNDKFTPESTANLLQRFQGQSHKFEGSAFSGSGGRGAHAGGSGGSYDRSGGGRETEKASAGASALDDTDVAGVNFNNYSRDALMRKLARTDDSDKNGDAGRNSHQPRPQPKPLPVQVSQASRCVLLKNMFDPTTEEGDGWVKEVEEDTRAECEAKYGHVVHIAVDPNTQGDTYVKFDRVQGGENAIKGLNGRFFGGRTISAQPMVEAVYGSLYSRSKDL